MVTKQVIIEMLFKRNQFTGDIQKVTSSMKNNAAMISQVSERYNSFGKAMRMPMQTMRTFGMAGGTAEMFTNKMARGAYQIRKFMHGLRGFRMEMLGVMFFGMGMSRMFSGLLRPAMEVAGVFDMWRMTLQQTFMPITMALMPLLQSIMFFFMNLPHGGKIVIGIFVVFAMIMGKILFLVSMLSLGMGSLVQLFTVTAVAAPLAAGGVGAFGAGAAFAQVAVIGLAGAVWALLWPILLIIAAIAAIIAIIMIWHKHSDKIRRVWDGLINWFKTTFTDINKGLKEIPEGVEEESVPLWDVLVEFFKDVWQSIKGVFADVIEAVVNPPDDSLWGNVLSLFTGLWNNLKKVFVDIVTYIAPPTYEGWDESEGIFGNYWDNLVIAADIGTSSVGGFIGAMIVPPPILASWITLYEWIVKVVHFVREMIKLYNLIPFVKNIKIPALTFEEKVVKTAKEEGTTIKDILTGQSIAPSGTTETQSAFMNALTTTTPYGGDFIWRKNGGMARFSPDDTIMGAKNGMAGGVVINQTLNINVSDSREIERMIESNNKNLVDDLRRMQKI